MATKKSFKNSPALQFINAEPPAEEAPALAAPAEKKESSAQEPPTRKTKPPVGKKPARNEREEGDPAGAAPKATAPKKAAGPKEDIPQTKPVNSTKAVPPQAAVVPTAAQAVPEESASKNPAAPGAEVPMKLNPMYIETRSKRVQLLMQPTLHTRLRQQAAQQGKSLNDLIHMVLERYAETGEGA